MNPLPAIIHAIQNWAAPRRKIGDPITYNYKTKGYSGMLNKDRLGTISGRRSRNSSGDVGYWVRDGVGSSFLVPARCIRARRDPGKCPE